MQRLNLSDPNLGMRAMRDYFRDPEPEEYMGTILFPQSEKITQLTASYIKGANQRPPAAGIFDLNSSVPNTSRGSIETADVELLKIAQRYQMDTKQLARLHEAQDHQIATYGALEAPQYHHSYLAALRHVYNDIQNSRMAVADREEALRFELISDGKITIRNHLGEKKGVIDYNVPDEHKLSIDDLPGGTAWSNPNADILRDILSIRNLAIDKGLQAPNIIITSSVVLSYILQNAGIRSKIVGTGGTDRIVSIDDLNLLFSSMQLPRINVYDKTYNSSATPQSPSTRFLPAHKFIMAYASPRGGLGESLYGITVEERTFLDQFQWSLTDRIITYQRLDVENLSASYTSVSYMVPTFPEAGNIFQLEVLEKNARMASFTSSERLNKGMKSSDKNAKVTTRNGRTESAGQTAGGAIDETGSAKPR